MIRGKLPAGRQALLVDRRQMLGLGAALVACASSPRQSWVPPRRLTEDPPVVVLIAIDGVRHQDVFFGPDESLGRLSGIETRADLVPHLMGLERTGAVLGAPGSAGFYASGPNFVSLPGYMEMLSGTSETLCTENDCKRMFRQTLIDDVQGEAPSDVTRSGMFTSWSKLDVAVAMGERGVVSTGRFLGSHLDVLESFPKCRRALRQGRNEEAGHGGFRSDHRTADLTLAYLEEARPEFVFVSLGETDERAHEGNYPEYLRALEYADRFVGQAARALERRQIEGRRTLLLVTTDHGRADNFRDHGREYPESAQSFLFAGGTVVKRRGQLDHERAYLKDIAPAIRKLRNAHDWSGDEANPLREILI